MTSKTQQALEALHKQEFVMSVFYKNGHINDETYNEIKADIQTIRAALMKEGKDA